MNKTTLQLLALALILILAQAVVFNNVCLFNVAVPFAFIFIILRLPLTLSQNWVLTIGFLLGLTIDIFSDTQGMNSLACTLVSGVRKPVLHLYFPRENELSDPCPSASSLGIFTYVKYAISMSLLYCSFIFIIEAFTFLNIAVLVMRIIASTLLTSAILIGIDSLTISRREKRL